MSCCSFGSAGCRWEAEVEGDVEAEIGSGGEEICSVGHFVDVTSIEGKGKRTPSHLQ
jgi:hypothetical protein